MQGWQDLLTQISIGVIVNAIIGILCWLIKREFLFFKGKMRIPQPLPFNRRNNQNFQHPLKSVLSQSMTSTTSFPSFARRHIKKNLNFLRISQYILYFNKNIMRSPKILFSRVAECTNHDITH